MAGAIVQGVNMELKLKPLKDFSLHLDLLFRLVNLKNRRMISTKNDFSAHQTNMVFLHLIGIFIKTSVFQLQVIIPEIC